MLTINNPRPSGSPASGCMLGRSCLPAYSRNYFSDIMRIRKILTIIATAALLAATTMACSDKKSKHADDDDNGRTEKRDKPSRQDDITADNDSKPDNYVTIEDLISKDVDPDFDAIVLDFNASWCGPCQALHPAVVEAARKYPDVLFVSIDVDQTPEYFERTGQQAIPYVVFANQNGVSTFLGTNELLPADKFYNLVEQTLNGYAADKSAESKELYGELIAAILYQMQ